MAKFDKEKLLQISENFIFVNWQGVVEILNLHRKWRNEKMKNIVLSVIDLGRELCSLFFHFFIFYANLEFRPAPCQWPKIKKVEIFNKCFLVTLAKLDP